MYDISMTGALEAPIEDIKSLNAWLELVKLSLVGREHKPDYAAMSGNSYTRAEIEHIFNDLCRYCTVQATYKNGVKMYTVLSYNFLKVQDFVKAIEQSKLMFYYWSDQRLLSKPVEELEEHQIIKNATGVLVAPHDVGMLNWHTMVEQVNLVTCNLYLLGKKEDGTATSN